jgi:hypothetical protein
MLLEHFPDLGAMRVLDLGGTPWSWDWAPARPAKVVTLNLGPLGGPPWVQSLVGDACDPPPDVRAMEFDLVYSNSVIEHVGGRWRRQAFSAVVHELAAHHWIQTPARSFPIEPHWLFPAFQFLPVAIRAKVSKQWKFSHVFADPGHGEDPVNDVLAVELLSVPEFRDLFPKSTLVRERVLGLTKSLIAVK